MSKKRNSKKKEGSPYTTTTLINKQITVCNLKDEIVYQIYKYDWEGLKGNIDKIKQPNRLWATLYNLFFGLSASGIIPVIEIWCEEGVATMYKIKFYVFLVIILFFLFLAIVFVLVDRGMKEKSSRSVEDVLGQMVNIENKIHKK
ncbi:MAG: hypothetical protein IIW58_05050 [Bacteroidales bacterium]|nr:hypothetical protein [Bacteroidales bacterium]